MNNSLTTTSGPTAIAISNLADATRLAEFMSKARTLPQHLQGSPGDCLMVVDQATRWGMSPFAVAQATAIVRGKLSFEGKLVAAAVHTSGVLDGRLDYDFSGNGDARKVVCSGKIRGESKSRTVEVALKDARTDNQWWSKTPDQMLTYHAARVWARRHTPEVMLGVYAPEEFEGQTIDVEAAPEPEPQRQVKQERPTDYPVLFAARLEKCETVQQVIQQRTAWTQGIAKTQEAGRPIAENVQEHVYQMIQDREDEIRDAQQDAPVEDVAEMPA